LNFRSAACLRSTPAAAGFGQQKKDDYTAHHYHQVSDEVDPNWDLSGAVQDVDLLFDVGYQVANGDKFPEWKPGTEFKAKRDAMLKIEK